MEQARVWLKAMNLMRDFLNDSAKVIEAALMFDQGIIDPDTQRPGGNDLQIFWCDQIY
jgi:hypothetical protein